MNSKEVREVLNAVQDANSAKAIVNDLNVKVSKAQRDYDKHSSTIIRKRKCMLRTGR